MPSWNELLNELLSQGTDEAASVWMTEHQTAALKAVGGLRGDRHVVSYFSAFLQKPQAPADKLSITHEDLNGFMSVVYGMDWSKGLTILIHTPGGSPNAAQSIVSYLRSKFDDIEVIIPAYAMSAGTMISLASDRLVMVVRANWDPSIPNWYLVEGQYLPKQ
jgi:ClpP class serine protease